MRPSAIKTGSFDEIMNELAFSDMEQQEATMEFPMVSYNWQDPHDQAKWREEWPLVREWVAEKERRTNAPYDAYYHYLKHALDHVTRPDNSYMIADQLVIVLEGMHHGRQEPLHGEIINRWWAANHAVMRKELLTRQGTVPLG